MSITKDYLRSTDIVDGVLNTEALLHHSHVVHKLLGGHKTSLLGGTQAGHGYEKEQNELKCLF